MESVGYLLKAAQQSLRAAMDVQLRELGVTTPQYAVLSFLADSPRLSSAQLARRAFVTPQTMNRVVANLETAGLVQRGPHPEVGRVLQTTLTRRGQRLLSECQRRVNDVEARMVANLTPAERRQLGNLLERCTRALRDRRRQLRAAE